MARTNKKGLDYFSHDTNTVLDTKIRFLKAKHGLIGYAVYFRLLEEIYQNSYYLEFSERDLILFASENMIEINVCNNIINDCINEGLFDRNKYEKYKILTSRRIQQNYIDGCFRRKEITLEENYLLFMPELDENSKLTINVVNNQINDNINSINDNINSQIEIETEKETETENEKEKENNFPPQKIEIINSEKKNLTKQPKNYKTDFPPQILNLLAQVVKEFPENIIAKLTPAQKWNWCKVIKDLNELDKYDLQTIFETILFARNNDFWKANLLSVASLRDKKKNCELTKFDKINAQRVSGNGSGNTSIIDNFTDEYLKNHSLKYKNNN
jgi:hypothetical protein